MWADEGNRSGGPAGRGDREKGEEKVKGLPEEWQERNQVKAGLGLTLPTHLQLLEVPGPGEWAGAAAPVLQQEGLFLGSKGRGQPSAGGLGASPPQWDPQWLTAGGGEVNFQRVVEASPLQEHSRPPAARAGGTRGARAEAGPVKEAAGPPWVQCSWEPTAGEVEPSPQQVGRLTKASLALLKVFTSCGDRDWNWAMWQPFAPGRVLRGVGTGTAPVLVRVVISISTSVQPEATSARWEDRRMSQQRMSGRRADGERGAEARCGEGSVCTTTGAHPAPSCPPVSGRCQQTGVQLSTGRLAPRSLAQSSLASLTSVVLWVAARCSVGASCVSSSSVGDGTPA